MSVPIIGGATFQRKIKCPRHFIANYKEDPFVREVASDLKNVQESTLKQFGLSKYKVKRDKWGRPVVNYKAFYQPEITAAFAIEHIYDPKNPICMFGCKGRCKRGMGKINELGIKRLHG